MNFSLPVSITIFMHIFLEANCTSLLYRSCRTCLKKTKHWRKSFIEMLYQRNPTASSSSIIPKILFKSMQNKNEILFSAKFRLPNEISFWRTKFRFRQTKFCLKTNFVWNEISFEKTKFRFTKRNFDFTKRNFVSKTKFRFKQNFVQKRNFVCTIEILFSQTKFRFKSKFRLKQNFV